VSTGGLRNRLAAHGWPPYRVLLITAGLVAFAVALVGVWYSLPPSETVPLLSEVVPPTSAPRTFALTPYAKAHLIANVRFEDGDGRKLSLADFRGKVVLLNIWATWCAPCRKEMPTLDRLQTRLESGDFEVVALSIDRDGTPVVRRFFDEINVHALKVYVDTSTEAMSKLAIVGVPTTLLIDRKGREIARYTGIAEWDRPDVVGTIEHYIAEGKS
jgi:thiol-disulfide isomerase/thioredoxin